MPVEAQGSLRLDAPTGRSLEIVADGDELRLDVPTWAELRAMMPRSFRERGRAVRRMADILRIYGLTLSLESAGKPFFQIGHGVSASWLSSMVGLAPARISLRAVALRFKR